MKNTLCFGALCAALVLPAIAAAQEILPTITVESDRPGHSLTAPTAAQAEREIRNTPGSVQVVPDTQYRNQRAATLKDVLDYVPGVIVQPKWGEDSRLSIRGSGLSRNFHLRSTQLFMDGIPINTADGYGDFQEIDPSAYRFVEVYKGANALRFGANALGGAINFVTPSGRDLQGIGGSIDAGSFGFLRFQAHSGGVFGPADYFITGSYQSQEGFRQHSDGESVRAHANLGYRFSDNAETRFYINSNTIRQRIPGELTRTAALTAPRTANADNVLRDWQRNIDSLRLANKTTLRFDDTTVEFGMFYLDRHLKHPISVWLDFDYRDYGGFARVVNESVIAGRRNRLVAGFNIHNGEVDARVFGNNPGAVKGPLFGRTLDKSQNYTGYAENSYAFLPDVALVTAVQFLHAVRDRTTLAGASVAGVVSHNLWSPKAGLLWNVDPAWQVFANLSRSAEAPSFGEGGAISGDFTRIRPQTATTFEIGTRGRRPNFTWDIAAYHAAIRNELQCLSAGGGICEIGNVPNTIHRGIELGFGIAIAEGVLTNGISLDKLWLNLAYTFSDFRFDNNPMFGNNQLPGAPRHFIRSELMYRNPNGLSFGPNVEIIPSAYFVDNANTVRTDAFALLGFRAIYEANKNASFYFDARNLTDVNYISAVSVANVFGVGPTNLFSPGTGRALYGGVRVAF
jgi:iron complex outermembrane receptor protein